MEIAHISYALGKTECTNDFLAEQFPGWDSRKIFRKTGIRSRRIADGQLVSDLAVQAAENLFAESSIDRASIDFLLLCTQSPDYFLPTTACLVQDRLGLRKNCGALDFNLGCSGYVYGLALAKGLLLGGMARTVLLITSETYSKHLHPQDRSVRTIFGDGASATLLAHDPGAPLKIGEFVFGTDGSGARNLIVPAGGMAQPRNEATRQETTDKQGNVRSLDNLFMDGPAIFNFSLDTVPPTVEETLRKNGLSMKDIDLWVFHQANRFMLDSLRDKIGIPEDRFYFNMADKGNTVSSSIPIALRDALDECRIRRCNRVMLVGFGVGYSWAGCVLEW